MTKKDRSSISWCRACSDSESAGCHVSVCVNATSAVRSIRETRPCKSIRSRGAEKVQMADARVDAQTLARRVPQSRFHCHGVRSSTVTSVGTNAGWRSMFCARISTDLNRPSAPMRCCVCSIALRRNRSPGTYAKRLRMMRSSTRWLPAISTGPKKPMYPVRRARSLASASNRSARGRGQPARTDSRGSEGFRQRVRPRLFPVRR